MIESLDYILDKKQRFWIVKKMGNKIYGNIVFIPDNHGKRYNNLTNKFYSKVKFPDGNFKSIKESEIIKIFQPKEYFRKNYKNIKGQWKNLADSLVNLGIKKKEIGIFGSKLIGFNKTKDIDFVVYGINNCNKIKNNIKTIKRQLGARNISKKHIAYQVQKYSDYHSKKNDFHAMLKNKWSSLQFKEDILSTIRFLYSEDELPKEIGIKKGKEKIISGIVKEEFSSYLPRIFYIKSKNKKIRVMTYFWAYQSCVKKNQKVRIFGTYNKKSKTVFLTKKQHWIKII